MRFAGIQNTIESIAAVQTRTKECLGLPMQTVFSIEALLIKATQPLVSVTRLKVSKTKPLVPERKTISPGGGVKGVRGEGGKGEGTR